jgi:alpha,alpha-trehalase
VYNRIKDQNFVQFARELNEIWIELSRKMKDEVKDRPELTSIIYVPNPFIIAGGRFLEFYYWDSYWIVRGLLVCEMYQTTRGILENFLSVIDRYGFIPNGGRIYYLERSHPPLLSGMIKAYVDQTHDFSFAIASIDLLVREFEYFMTNKTVLVKGHRLARYIDHSQGPRPESYREDVEVGKEFATEEERQSFYSECKAGGESGMDFSSRWFINENGENTGSLRNLKTRSVIAVELNAILHWNAKIIAEFYGYAGNSEKQKEFEGKAQEILVVSALSRIQLYRLLIKLSLISRL